MEFPTHDVAKNVYITLNNSPIPGTGRVFKLNWATHGHGGTKIGGGGATATAAP